MPIPQQAGPEMGGQWPAPARRHCSRRTAPAVWRLASQKAGLRDLAGRTADPDGQAAPLSRDPGPATAGPPRHLEPPGGADPGGCGEAGPVHGGARLPFRPSCVSGWMRGPAWAGCRVLGLAPERWATPEGKCAPAPAPENLFGPWRRETRRSRG